MAKTTQKGYLCTLSVDDGIVQTPEVVGRARDVELSANGSTVDISSRGGAGWKEHLAGIKEWEVSVDQLWVADDAALVILRDAFMAGTALDIELLDGAGDGFEGSVVVTSMKKGQPLDGGVVLPVTLKGSGELSVVTAQ